MNHCLVNLSATMIIPYQGNSMANITIFFFGGKESLVQAWEGSLVCGRETGWACIVQDDSLY